MGDDDNALLPGSCNTIYLADQPGNTSQHSSFHLGASGNRMNVTRRLSACILKYGNPRDARRIRIGPSTTVEAPCLHFQELSIGQPHNHIGVFELFGGREARQNRTSPTRAICLLEADLRSFFFFSFSFCLQFQIYTDLFKFCPDP